MMEDDFQYLVFIKCDSVLSQQKKKKLENYIKIRRKSGGGDCGPLTAMADNHYCVAFKDQKGTVTHRSLSVYVLMCTFNI